MVYEDGTHSGEKDTVAEVFRARRISQSVRKYWLTKIRRLRHIESPEMVESSLGEMLAKLGEGMIHYGDMATSSNPEARVEEEALADRLRSLGRESERRIGLDQLVHELEEQIEAFNIASEIRREGRAQ